MEQTFLFSSCTDSVLARTGRRHRVGHARRAGVEELRGDDGR
jgi:hypothetical protein